MSAKRRNRFILLLVLGLIAASLVVISTKPTKLGLDLKGGVELVYQAKPTPQQPEIDQEALDRTLDIMRERVDQLGVAEPELQRFGKDQISVGLPDVDNAKKAQEQVGRVAQLFFYDWEPNVIGPNGKADATDDSITGGAQAGTAATLSLFEAVQRASKRPQIDRKNNTHNGLYYLFNEKTNQLLAGPDEKKQDLFEDLPNGKQPKDSKIFFVKPGTVVVQAEAPDDLPSNRTFDRWYVLDDNPALLGTDIKNPRQIFDQRTNEPVVSFEFTKKGRDTWQSVTREIAQRGAQRPLAPGQDYRTVNQHFAIVLDDELISAPFIDFRENPDGIDGGNGSQIQGGFTIQSAQDLADLLRTGALPVKLELISQTQVSATLGKQALDQGLYAGFAGLLLVALFLIVFYRILGLIAVTALVFYSIYFYALIKLIPITLSLPGIAGLILTIGVAADANIVIFERIKEEIRAGRSVAGGIAAGYKKGLSAIIDANVVTLITAFILFILATSGVKGFAFTLGIGTIVSLFTAVLATQAILGTLGSTKLLSHKGALGAGEQKARWQYDFVGASKWFFTLSGVILLVGGLAIGGKGINFGLDFESGTKIKTPLEKPVTETQLRQTLSSIGVKDATIQRVTEPDLGKNVFQISTENLKPAEVQKVKSDLDEKYGVGAGFSNQSVGPTFGKAVANSALIAVISSLLVIMIYIGFRFEWKYAVPVFIAIIHDILITGGIYALTGREMTSATVAALLTIIGYSLYDTIIVFDRVRENVPRMPRAAFSQVVNRTMSEVLTRSLATSFSTLLPVAALLFFGGETLQDFAFALLVGVASGTYSSIFIASPVLTYWKEREPIYRGRHKHILEQFGTVPPFADSGATLLDDLPKKTTESRRLTTPEEPGEISKSEFDELVKEVRSETGSSGPAKVEPDLEDTEKSKKSKGEKKPKRRSRSKRHGRPR